jgi:hypothetical protein
MTGVTTSPDDRTLREQAVHLIERLNRITAGAKVLRALVDEIRHDIPPEPMLAMLDALDRDIVLVSQEIERVRERAARELASMR